MTIYALQSLGLYMVAFGACAWMAVGFLLASGDSTRVRMRKFDLGTKIWFAAALVFIASPYLLSFLR